MSKILPRALKRSSKTAQPGYGADGVPPAGGEGYYEYPDFSQSSRGGGDTASDGGGVASSTGGGGGGGRLRMLRSASGGNNSRSSRFLQRRSASAPMDSMDEQQHGVDGGGGEENRGGSKRGLFRRTSNAQKEVDQTDNYPPLAGGERVPASEGGESDVFAARRSRHISTNFATADNDSWQENLAVVEVPATSPVNSAARGGGGGWWSRSKHKATSVTADNGMRLAIRSYFQSTKTGQRVWDEPPSGASDIQYATPEVRRMAELQMQDLQVTTSVAAAALQEEQQQHSSGMETGEKPKRGGLFSRNKNGERKHSPVPIHKRLSYRKGAAAYGATSAMAESRMEAKSAYERDIQMALAMSLQTDQNQPQPPIVPPRQMVGGEAGPRRTKEEDEALLLATALSISEAEAAGGAPRPPSAPPMPPHYPATENGGGEAHMRKMMNEEETPVLWASSEAGSRGGMLGTLNNDESNTTSQPLPPAYNQLAFHREPPHNGNTMKRSQSERVLYEHSDMRVDNYDHDRRSLAKMIPEPDMGKERRGSGILNRSPSMSKLKSTMSHLSPMKSKTPQPNPWGQQGDNMAPPDPDLVVGAKQQPPRSAGLSASGSARRLLGRRKSDIDEGHDRVAEAAGLL